LGVVAVVHCTESVHCTPMLRRPRRCTRREPVAVAREASERRVARDEPIHRCAARGSAGCYHPYVRRPSPAASAARRGELAAAAWPGLRGRRGRDERLFRASGARTSGGHQLFESRHD
jgi:hypothetical protein